MIEQDDIVAELDPCPDEEALQAVLAGKAVDSRVRDSIKAHVRLCSSCRRKAKSFAPPSSDDDEFIRLAAQKLKARQDQIKAKTDQGPIAGSVWRTVPESEDDLYGPLVIVLKDPSQNNPELVQVAEVSEEIQQAIDTDIIVNRRPDGLSFDFMIRAGHVFWTYRQGLKAYAGEISSEQKNILDFCLDIEKLNQSVPLSKHEFAKDVQGTRFMRRRGIVSGVPATSHDDPRLAFLDFSRRRISYLISQEPQTDYSKVVSLPVKDGSNRLLQVLLPLAAMFVGVVVTASVMYVSSQRSLGKLQTKHQQEIQELDRYYAQQAEEAVKKLADSQAGEEALKARLSNLDREKAGLQKKIAQLDESLAGRNREWASLKSKIAELEESDTSLKKERAKLASQRQEAERRLAKLYTSEKQLRAEVERLSPPPTAMLSQGPRPNVRLDPVKGKELLQAARTGNLGMVTRLLGRDKDLVRFVDLTQGFTALQWATYEDHPAVVAYLLKHGASVDSPDFDSETPLMLAARLGFGEVVELLIKNGADRTARNSEGKTALDLALANGHKEVAEILKSR